MNKKILFSTVLLSLILPLVSLAAYTCTPDVVSIGSDAESFARLVCNIKNLVIGIGTPVVIIGWVVAGILYLTAAGAPDKMNTAKMALEACVIGTVLISLAIGTGAIVSIIQNALGIAPST